MWKLEPNGRVKNVEVTSRNGILQCKGIIDLRLIGRNSIILIIRKIIMSFLLPLGGSIGLLSLSMSVIDYSHHMDIY